MKILFFSDGSLQAEKAVCFAAPIAAACQAETTFLGVAAKAVEERSLRRTLKVCQEIFQEYRLQPELIVRVGKARREVLKHTQEVHYDLMVVGAVRENPFWRVLNPVWKSVKAYNLFESVEPHVLVVIGYRPGLRRLLLCTDGSETLNLAAEFAGRMAQAVNAEVDLFHVMPKLPAIYGDLIQLDQHVERLLQAKSKLGRTLRHQTELLKHLDVFGEFRLRHGLVLPELLKELQQGDYDLVVCGSTPAKQRLHKYFMGDTTRQIVNQTGLSVLIVRTGHRTLGGLAKDFLARPFQRAPKQESNS